MRIRQSCGLVFYMYVCNKYLDAIFFTSSIRVCAFSCCSLAVKWSFAFDVHLIHVHKRSLTWLSRSSDGSWNCMCYLHDFTRKSIFPALYLAFVNSSCATNTAIPFVYFFFGKACDAQTFKEIQSLWGMLCDIYYCQRIQSTRFLYRNDRRKLTHMIN